MITEQDAKLAKEKKIDLDILESTINKFSTFAREQNMMSKQAEVVEPIDEDMIVAAVVPTAVKAVEAVEVAEVAEAVEAVEDEDTLVAVEVEGEVDTPNIAEIVAEIMTKALVEYHKEYVEPVELLVKDMQASNQELSDLVKSMSKTSYATAIHELRSLPVSVLGNIQAEMAKNQIEDIEKAAAADVVETMEIVAPTTDTNRSFASALLNI
jgi:hypothetical protein